ncbi:hypothetical protein PBAL39_07016 [Pedobacter sp. BAL39]|uniref:hypothetical protein n=1 Tax=Pedobacter sp. BAL39 TaxID=391596 RepID=UPI000155A066|nr:hypothetical protein [Pedobacter sp. BAL39]EDM35911.1 hypothetical protein PBAL39_07016 [Pedobacter sp. BAL39]
MKQRFPFKTCLKIACIVLCLSVLFSCKQEVGKPEKPTVSIDTTIETLKVYFSKLVRVDVKHIVYNGQTKMFSIDGIDQLSLEQMQAAYESNPYIHYKDGHPVEAPTSSDINN